MGREGNYTHMNICFKIFFLIFSPFLLSTIWYKFDDKRDDHMLGVVPKHFFLEGKLIKFVIPTYFPPPQKEKRKKKMWSKILGWSHQPVKEKNPILPLLPTYQKNHLEKSKNFRVIDCFCQWKNVAFMSLPLI